MQLFCSDDDEDYDREGDNKTQATCRNMALDNFVQKRDTMERLDLLRAPQQRAIATAYAIAIMNPYMSAPVHACGHHIWTNTGSACANVGNNFLTAFNRIALTSDAT